MSSDSPDPISKNMPVTPKFYRCNRCKKSVREWELHRHVKRCHHARLDNKGTISRFSELKKLLNPNTPGISESTIRGTEEAAGNNSANHQDSSLKSTTQRKSRKKPSGNLVRCEYCHQQLREKNLRNHIKKNHWYKHTSRPLPGSSSKQEDAKYKRQALSDMSTRRDPQIQAYVSENPEPDRMGKFGVPQDPYRYNFYGSRSMEKDKWRKS